MGNPEIIRVTSEDVELVSTRVLHSDSASVASQQDQNHSGYTQWMLPVLALVCVLGLATGAALLFGRGQAPQAHRGQAPQAHIERVLQQDSVTTDGVSSVDEVVSRMRAIDLTGCPKEFREAYVSYIHAWEDLALVEREKLANQEEAESVDFLVQLLIRGFLGDPLGKVNEHFAARNELQRNQTAALRQIQLTRHRVEDVAIAYGVEVRGPTNGGHRIPGG